MKICDRAGNVIAISDPPDSRMFDKMEIRNAFLAGLELEGISFDGSDLQGSDFSGSDLYGANLCDSSFESCTFAHADLRSAFIHNVSFRNADMRCARLSLDELGGELWLNEVDFTGANLDGADFTGAVYDSMTIFPKGFDPTNRGLIPKAEADSYVRDSRGQVVKVSKGLKNHDSGDSEAPRKH